MINLDVFNSTTNYEIYLVNEGADAQNFWCFLQKPQGVPTSGVYANSSAMLSVLPNYQGTNSFTIPLQYKLGAGASNNAVGLDVKIDSSIIKDVSLEQLWEAKYANVPPNQGPQMNIVQGENSPAGTIGFMSNDFNKVNNEDNGWFSNMSFGIESSSGFMGLTWSPSPNVTNTITPKFAFYIATGSYTSNSLADITTISNTSAKVELSDFENLEATVTLTASGNWIITPGKPKSVALV